MTKFRHTASTLQRRVEKCGYQKNITRLAIHGKTFLHSNTGAKINTYQNIPTRDPETLLHITHGLAERAYRYEWFSCRFLDQNFAVFAHDLR